MIVTKSLYWIRSQSAGWWKSLPAFTGKTQTQRKRHHRVSPAHSTGRQSWLRSPGWSWTDQAGRSSGSSTRAPRWPDHHRLAVQPTPAGREDTKHSMHRREALESSTVFPARLIADKLYKPSKARLLGFKKDNLGSHCTVGFTEQEV